MSVTNGIVGAPIGLYEVAKLLGCSKFDVGSVCTFSAINIWAKWKPFRDTAKGYSSVATSQGAAALVNYGLTIPSSSSMSGLVALYEQDARMHGWTYSAPNGSTYPYRLTDFVGYNHYAQCQLSDMTASATTIEKISSQSLVVEGVIEAASTNGISLSELKAGGIFMNTMYPALIAKCGSTYVLRTARRTIGNIIDDERGGIFSVNFSSDNLAIGDWTFYPCLCSNQHVDRGGAETDNSTLVDTLTTLPFLNKIQCSVIQGAGGDTGVDVTLVIAEVGADSLSYTLTFTNTTNQTRLLSGITLYMMKSDKVPPSADSSEKQINLGDWTLGANEEKTFSGSPQNVSLQVMNAGIYVAYYYVGSTQYKTYGEKDETIEPL